VGHFPFYHFLPSVLIDPSFIHSPGFPPSSSLRENRKSRVQYRPIEVAVISVRHIQQPGPPSLLFPQHSITSPVLPNPNHLSLPLRHLHIQGNKAVIRRLTPQLRNQYSQKEKVQYLYLLSEINLFPQQQRLPQQVHLILLV
jgi:hypothetical protein